MIEPLLLCGHGYTGRAIADAWVARGGVVWASVREYDTAARLARTGVRGFVAEFGGPELPWISGLDTPVGVITFGTTGLADPGEMVASAVRWLSKHGCSAAVYLSSTSVYGDCDGREVSEDDPASPNTEMGRRRVLAETEFERASSELGVRSVILRLPGIYGPHRTPRTRFIDRSYRFPSGQRWSNRIFVDDVATAVCHALREPLNGVYNASDGAPFRASEFAAWVSAELDVDCPSPVGFEELSARAQPFWQANRRVSNARLVATGWRPSVGDYREGHRLAWSREGGAA